MNFLQRSRSLSLIILSLLLITALSGCKTRMQYIPADNVRIEYRDRNIVDSITTTDTIRIAERGDTVRIDRVRYRDRVRIQVDTIMRIDTITRVQVQEVQVQPSFFQKAERMLLGGLIGIIIIVVGYLFIRFILPLILRRRS